MTGKYVEVSPPVTAALNAGISVVALECGSFCSLPYPENLRRMQELEQAVWQQNCVPAYLALIRGRIKVGLTPAEADELMRERIVCSRAELPAAAARRQTAALLPSAAVAAAALADIVPLIVADLTDEIEDVDALALFGRLIFAPHPDDPVAAIYAARSVPAADEDIAADVWLMQRALGSPESILVPCEVSFGKLAGAACRVAVAVRKKLEYDERMHTNTASARRESAPLCATCPTAMELHRRRQQDEADRIAREELEERRRAESRDIYDEYSERYPINYDLPAPEEEDEYDELPDADGQELPGLPDTEPYAEDGPEEAEELYDPAAYPDDASFAPYGEP